MSPRSNGEPGHAESVGDFYFRQRPLFNVLPTSMLGTSAARQFLHKPLFG
jgi:hypothetical protein